MKDFPYEDIVHLSRPRSLRHAPMPLIDRGAQFAPFAALRGYDGILRSAAREKVEAIELAEEGERNLNEKLCFLHEHIPEQPEAVFTHYAFDPYTEHGEYETIRGRVKWMDPARQLLGLADGKQMAFSRILNIEIL